MYIKIRYRQRTSSNYTNSIIAGVLLLFMVLVELSDGVVFDLAECSLIIEVLTLVNVVVFSTLLIGSVYTYEERQQDIRQLLITFVIWSTFRSNKKILKSCICINSP